MRNSHSSNVGKRAGHSLDHKLQQFSQLSIHQEQEGGVLDRCEALGELFQPSTVYVDAEFTKNERLLHPYLPHLPHNFIARLKRQIKNKDAREAADSKTNNAFFPVDSKADQDQESAARDDLDPEEFTPSCYVRVVAIDRKEGLTDEAWQEAADQVLSEQPLLHGHVIVSDLLRRQLRLDSTSSVWLQTGSVDLVIPRKVCIFPLSSV
ncbi:hypothetical protein EGW08_022550, partial [Elysia chlorotica]